MRRRAYLIQEHNRRSESADYGRLVMQIVRSQSAQHRSKPTKYQFVRFAGSRSTELEKSFRLVYIKSQLLIVLMSDDTCLWKLIESPSASH